MVRGVPIFLNKWSPSASLLKEELSHVLVWVNFHDVPLVECTSDGLSLMATKIGNPMRLDTYTNSMRLESWGRSSYARLLIEINACNDFSDYLVMVVPNLEGNGYTKETIRIQYEWKPSLYNSFEALNVGNPIIEEVATGSKATTSVDDDGKPLENVDYPDNLGSDNEVEPIKNEMESFLASKLMGVGYGPKILLEQWRENDVDDDYDSYDNDMCESQKIPNNIQTICDNLDIKLDNNLPRCLVSEELSLISDESDLAGMWCLHLHLYMNPEIKQSTIKLVDEYGFVIRPDLVGLTSRSVRTNL
ncbi:RNA-directed DNA polymerase, eukaryota, reverse transcriptase zinc-binding domain protein [Tanacetum coccineum]